MKYTISDGSRKIVSNVFFSGVGQLIALGSPLLITPYLIRAVGIEKFGVIVSAQSVMMYISYLVDYSFNIDATQQASVNRDNPQILSKLFSDIFWAKSVLLIVSSFLVIALMLLIPIFRANQLLFLLSYSIVLGKFFMPQWLLIGTERIKEYTFFSTISKVIVYILVLLVVTDSSRYIYVNLLWGGGEIVLFPVIYWKILHKMDINRLSNFSWLELKERLLKGWPIFVSNSVNGLYIYSNLTILTLFASPYVIGSYAVAEKIMLLMKQITGTIFQATYPHACKLAEVGSSEKLKSFLRKEAYFFTVVFIVLGILVTVMADYIIYFFTGKYGIDAINLLRGLAFVPLIVSLNMSAAQMMLIKGIRRQYATIVMCTGVINVAANFILVPVLGSAGTVIAIIVTEIFNTVALHYFLFRDYPTLQIFNLYRNRSFTRGDE